MSKLTGLEKTTTSSRKCLRGRKILKANDQINKVMYVLTITFVNPFDKLHNFVSGSPVNEGIAQNLSVSQIGVDLMQVQPRRHSSNGSVITFNNSAFKAKIQVSGKRQEVLLHRDIFETTAALSSKTKAGIYLDKVLEHPLVQVSMTPSCRDPIQRETTTSKLLDTALNDMEIFQGTLLDLRTTHHYYVELADSVRNIHPKL